MDIDRHKILRQNNQEANAFTKQCIESALIHLMSEKSFNDISITDITRRAGVSRTAYYRNYTSKEDILSGFMQSINHTLSKILKQYDPITQAKQSWMALLENVQSFAPQYKLLLKAGFGEKLIMEFAATMNETTSKNDWNRYYSNMYWAGAIYNVISAWIRNDMNIPIEQLAEIGCNLMQKGIHTILEYGDPCR
ncbi:MAG: TetR/AcrR family transcriptional regulator [Proteobacteria bacterium]|nr:TetR/AcrR family transcriptional regulator [Pseudomonadota bacterium]